MPTKKDQLVLLFSEIQQGNANAFDALFLGYYDKLAVFAQQFTKQIEIAEEITSELFVKIWLKRTELPILANPEVYLFVAVKNASLNYLRANKKQTAMFIVPNAEQPLEMPAEHFNCLEEKELSQLLDLTVAALPPQRKMIFKLIKEQGMKRHEAAEILGLSVRTVENQLHQALITLGGAISGYLGYDPRKRNIKKEKLSALASLFF